MPEITIELNEGRSIEQKRALCKGITDVWSRPAVTADRVVITIHETQLVNMDWLRSPTILRLASHLFFENKQTKLASSNVKLQTPPHPQTSHPPKNPKQTLTKPHEHTRH